MRESLIAVSMAAVFVLGCVTGALMTPKANAGRPAVQRWQYRCHSDHTVKSIEEAANRAGERGWEMVVGSKAGWCFKRPR